MTERGNRMWSSELITLITLSNSFVFFSLHYRNSILQLLWSHICKISIVNKVLVLTLYFSTALSRGMMDAGKMVSISLLSIQLNCAIWYKVTQAGGWSRWANIISIKEVWYSVHSIYDIECIYRTQSLCCQCQLNQYLNYYCKKEF